MSTTGSFRGSGRDVAMATPVRVLTATTLAEVFSSDES
jgi:hypothetical protein